MSVRGIEMQAGASLTGASLKEQGYGFVVGSLGVGNGHLTAEQARDFLAAGLSIVSIYDGTLQPMEGATVGYDPRLFEDPESLLHTLAYSNGATDGRAAHAAAKAAGQPAGSAIYFEVNANVTSGIAYVMDYFRGIAEGLGQAAGGAADYRIGVYGSGFVVEAVHVAALADYKWLAAAPWRGTAEYAAYDLREVVDSNPEDLVLAQDEISDARADGNVGQWSTSAAQPNLVIYDLATRSPSLPPGSSVPISFAIGNAGTATADASTATLYLSTDEAITEDDTVLGVVDVPSLASKGASEGSLIWTIPADLLAGTYYVGISVAPVAGEISRTDNAYAMTYTVAGAAASSPNLVINALDVASAAVPAGAAQTISFEVGNAGTMATPASSATLYLSTDATISASDTFLANFTLPSLAPLASATRSLSTIIPAGLVEGTYFVGVIAGPVAGEANVNDNIFATGFSVGAAAEAMPNLVVNDLSLGSAVVPAGGSQVIDLAIGNAGATASAASSVTVYLSADAIISASDIALGSVALPSLAAGGASAARLVATLPDSLPDGMYHIGAVADPVPGEPNIHDNAYAVSFSVAQVAGSVAISDASIVEGNAGSVLATFVLTRSGGTAPFSIDYATSDGGATIADGDYVSATGTVSFAANERVRTITVAVNGDLANEADGLQSFSVDLSAGTNGVAISDGHADGTIIDDDRPNHLPAIVARDLQLHSGRYVPAAAMIQSVSDADNDAVLQYAFRDTAEGGFLRIAGVAQAAGSWATVAAADLLSLEYVGSADVGAEQVDIRVYDGQGWSDIVHVTASTVADHADDYGESPETAGAVGLGVFTGGTIEAPQDADWFAASVLAGQRYEFNLEGTGPSEGALPDPVLELRDGTGTLLQVGMHDAGSNSARASLVYTAPSNDTVYLSARSAGDALGSYRLSATDRPLARVSVEALNAVRAEGRAGITPFTFAISRQGNLDIVAEVGFAVAPSGPHPASAADFDGGQFPSGTVTFVPGEASKIITMGVATDTLPEESDTFSVAISSASPDVVIDGASAGGRIVDDDNILDLVVLNTITGERVTATPRFYEGPVTGLEKEIIFVTTENLAVTVNGDNWFICAGSGTDALSAHGGRNVLDGGTGSNFLSGGIGEDSFFLDARDLAADTWSTILGFGVEDSITVWGISPHNAVVAWADDLGTEGYSGLTLQATAPGKPSALVTLAGFSRADLDSGKIQMAFGASDQTGPYAYIHQVA